VNIFSEQSGFRRRDYGHIDCNEGASTNNSLFCFRNKIEVVNSPTNVRVKVIPSPSCGAGGAYNAVGTTEKS